MEELKKVILSKYVFESKKETEKIVENLDEGIGVELQNKPIEIFSEVDSLPVE